MERRGNTKEPTCEKCRREKENSLNRQVCDLVKRHGGVEVVGKEILGWYMLLPAEDRRFIKEYGHISDYIKDNPSLLIINNWVQLKSENIEIRDSIETCSFFMESSQSQEGNSSTSYTQDYCDRMLRCSQHADGDSPSDILTFDGADDFGKGDYAPENESLGTCDTKPLRLEIWDSSTDREHKRVCANEENIKDCLTPDVPDNQETAQDLQYVTSCVLDLTREPLVKKQLDETKESSKSDLSYHYMKPKAGKNFQEHKSWLKCFSSVADNPIDPDCSSVDDETFFSVKSGSFYSRSSSQFSLDDSTDVEQCDFEEALEDLSCFSLNRQSSFVDDLSPVWDPFSEIKNVKRTTHEQIHIVEKSSLYSKAKQRNVSCNTDLSWMSYGDKETQTNQNTHDCGVNTDSIPNTVESGLFSQTQTNEGVGIAKNVEECMGGGTSVSLESLMQRAVKAELQLVDVQRWLCWQMCWKTQQQTLEKQSHFSLNKEPSKPSTSVTEFNLQSALAEVEQKYLEMKAKIQSGTPLDKLIPLTLQLTTVETSADNLLKDCSEKQNVSDVPAEEFHNTKYMKNDPGAEFVSCLDKCNKKPNETQPTQHGSDKPRHYYVHVGNIAHSVKEVELMDVFQKYHVSNIFLEESSLSCCYAVLTFSKSEDTEAAIREMDGKMMHGKKLKVRAIKTSNCNLSLAFQNIKSVSKETPQDGKGCDTIEPKESFMPVPPNSDSTQPRQIQSDETHSASVCGSLTNANVNLPSSKYYTPTNTNQGFLAAPSWNPPVFSNFMAQSYQCMMQSHHSNMISYSSMPSFMCVPFSYPLYTLPNPPLCQSSVTYPNNFVPSSYTKSNINAQFGKGDSNFVHAQPVKYIHRTDRQSKSRISRPFVQNKVTSSNDHTKILEKDTVAKFMKENIATVKCVNEPTSSFATSSNAKPSENASQENPLKMPVTRISSEGRKLTDCLSSSDNFSEPSPIKPAAPLRFPAFVPPSVTIPEANKPSLNPCSTSEKKTDTSSSATSRQSDSLSARTMDWGVYPQLTSSEVPIIVIPNKLNFSQFKRVVTFLTEKHKNATREQIVGALEDVRKSTGGSFGCMTIPEIIFATSSKLEGHIPPA